MRRLTGVSVTLAGRPHDLRFLGDPDRGYLGPAPQCGLLQVGLHHLGLTLVTFEPDHRDVIRLSVGAHRPPELVADLGEDRGRGDRHAPVIVQEVDHPARGLQAIDEPR